MGWESVNVGVRCRPPELPEGFIATEKEA